MEIAGDSGSALQATLRSLGAQAAARTARSAVLTRRFVYAAVIAFALLTVGASLLHYYAHGYARLDLGDMVQAVWTTAHGHFLEITTEHGRQMNRLGIHADPFLALLAPLWLIWPSPAMLLVVEGVAVASGTLPVYWLARKHLASERAAAHVVIAYLLYPATQFNAYMPGVGFHAVSLALPLVLYAIWFLDEKRLVPFAIVAVLAGMTKEEIPAAIGCLGIWYAFRRGERIAGAAIAGIGFAWSAVNFLVLIPHFSVPGENPLAGRYADVGSTPRGIVHTAFTHPGVVLHEISNLHKLIYVLLFVVPFLGLWALEPLLALGAAPDLIINLLSSRADQTTLGYQYTAGIVPFLVAATILGVKRLRRPPEGPTLALVVAVGCVAVYSPFLLLPRDVSHVFGRDPVRAAQSRAIELVAPGDPVSASNGPGGALSARRFVFTFPHVGTAKWAVVDEHDTLRKGVRAKYLTKVARLLASGRWKVVYASHGIRVLRRVES